jgi:hypothetical protein
VSPEAMNKAYREQQNLNMKLQSDIMKLKDEF